MGIVSGGEGSNSTIIAASRIPAILRIGVTGHRNLSYPALVEKRVREVLTMLDKLLTGELRHSPHTYMVISPLAEGADRLVAREVLTWGSTDGYLPPFLEVVLPMPEESYALDFVTEASMKEFRELMKQARLVRIMKKAVTREAAFEKAGKYVVNSSDVLIAVWNGKAAAGKGGTAEIVEYARAARHPLIWIHSETGEVRYEWEVSKVIDHLRTLDKFNKGWLMPQDIARHSAHRYASFSSKALDAGLTEDVLKPAVDDLMPKYARASLLARRHQRIFNGAALMVYALATLAVASVAMQVIFIDDVYNAVTAFVPWLPLSIDGLIMMSKMLEILCMLAILVIIYYSDHIQREWTDYRFLAERIRTAILLTIAGIRYEPLRYPSFLEKSGQSDYWIVKAFSWVWYATPPGQPISDPVRLKRFVKSAWIDDQIEFYQRNGLRHRRKHSRMELASLLLFLCTLFAAAISLVGLASDATILDERILDMAGIILPMAGASIAGLLAIHGYRRNADRYSQMVAPMQNVSKRLEMAEDVESLVDIVEEANQLMLRENQDWRVNLLSQKLRP